MNARSTIISAMLLPLALVDCTLDRSGLAPVEPLDPDFEGCFERTMEPNSGHIGITRRRGNALEGWGRHIFPDAGLWSFTGIVDDERSAELTVTTESGDELTVDAMRSGVRPDDTLGLLALGTGMGRVTLQRCR